MRIGVIGYGTHGHWAVVPSIRKAADCCELAAVADLSEANLARLDDPAVAKYTDHRRMLAEEDLDAVFIATLPEHHAPLTLEALDAGLHVLCEKPLADTVANAEAMVAAARRAGRHLLVNFETRYAPENVQVRDWIAEGRLGRVEAVHLANMWDAHKTNGTLGERRFRLADRFGALDCGIHKADLARFYTGAGAWRVVRAVGSWFGEATAQPTHISVIGHLDPGVMVSLNASFTYTAFIEPRHKAVYLDVVGTEGVIQLAEGPDGGERLKLVSASLTTELGASTWNKGNAIAQLIRDLAGAVDDGRPLPDHVPTGDDGLIAQDFCERANRDAVDHRAPTAEDVTAREPDGSAAGV